MDEGKLGGEKKVCSVDLEKLSRFHPTMNAVKVPFSSTSEAWLTKELLQADRGYVSRGAGLYKTLSVNDWMEI